jgi:acetyl esterase/lipase
VLSVQADGQNSARIRDFGLDKEAVSALQTECSLRFCERTLAGRESRPYLRPSRLSAFAAWIYEYPLMISVSAVRRYNIRIRKARGRIVLLATAVLSVGAHAVAQTSFPIWNGTPPGSENWRQTEITYIITTPQREREASPLSATMVRNVAMPTLTAYFPQAKTAAKTAVIICPGGGFRFLSWQFEGTEMAKWLAAHGLAAFVLKYRLVQTPVDPQKFDQELAAFITAFSQVVSSGQRPRSLDEILPDPASREARALGFADAQQAVKYIRSHSAEWGISPDRVGMLGFSVGGFLVTDVIMANDPASRLDFAALIYGGEVGKQPIPAGAPPLFMAVAQDDRWMSGIERDLFSSWDLAGKAVEFHSFDRGGHGFGTRKQNLPVDHWMDSLARWMVSRRLMGGFDE